MPVKGLLIRRINGEPFGKSAGSFPPQLVFRKNRLRLLIGDSPTGHRIGIGEGQSFPLVRVHRCAVEGNLMSIESAVPAVPV